MKYSSHQQHKNEVLQVSMEDLLLEQGMYNNGEHSFVDLDKIVEDVDEVLYNVTHPQKGI